jgi:hypothetical protein
MKLRMTWFLGGCAIALFGGMNAMACSSSSPSNNTDAGPGMDAGKDAPAKTDTGSGSDTSTDSPSTDVTTPTGDGGGCGKPSKLHPDGMEAGIFCPFSVFADGGEGSCFGGQVCCQTPETEAGTPSTCQPAGTTGGKTGTCPVASSVVWECEETQDCIGKDAGPICCGFGTPHVDDAGCTNYEYVSGAMGKGSVCAASAAACAGGFVICESQAECTAVDAGTCTPLKYHGNELGFCQ